MDLMSFVFVAAMLPGSSEAQPVQVAEYQATPADPELYRPTNEEIAAASGQDEVEEEAPVPVSPKQEAIENFCNLDRAMIRVAKEKREEERVTAAGGVENMALRRSLAVQFVKGIDLFPVAIKKLKAAGVKDSEVSCGVSEADETMVMNDVAAFQKKTGKK